MQKVVLDSDIIIDAIRLADKTLRGLLELVANKKIQLFLPSVVVTELMAGQETKVVVKVSLLEELFTQLQFIPMDYSLSKEIGFLLRDYKQLKLGDAIVAATTLSLNGKLATRNIKDFESIKGLKFFKNPESPFDIFRF